MKLAKAFVLVVAVLFILAAVVRSGRMSVATVSMEKIKTVNVGEAAPDFSVKTLGGNDLKLSELRGHYVLLDFWASWCGQCIQEVPNIKAAYESFGKDPRLVMISVSLDEKVEDAKSYCDQNGMAWNQVYLAEQWHAPIVQAYGVRSIPSIWLIGPTGIVIAKDLRGEGIKTAVAMALGK